MDLVIEATDESGRHGLFAISFAHYGWQNGDAMRDPEMSSELGFLSGPDLNPYFYRNDYVGVEHWSRTTVGSHYVHLFELYNQPRRFARTWDNNIRLLGYAETFDPQKHVRG